MQAYKNLLEAAQALSKRFGTNMNLSKAMQDLDAAIAEVASIETHSQIDDAMRRKFINRAHEMYHDEGTLEVDTEQSTPEQRAEAVSASDPMNGGAYVKAWVWVPAEEIGLELEEEG